MERNFHKNISPVPIIIHRIIFMIFIIISPVADQWQKQAVLRRAPTVGKGKIEVKKIKSAIFYNDIFIGF